MFIKLKPVVYSISAALFLHAAVTSAEAACNAIAGTWYLHGISIETFSDGDSTSADVYKCTVQMNAGGDFSNAPCAIFATDGEVLNTQATGNVTVSAICNITGTVTIAGDPRPMKIRSGHFNGTMATIVATQGGASKVVHHLTFIKK